jgi:hypothetical protein
VVTFRHASFSRVHAIVASVGALVLAASSANAQTYVGHDLPILLDVRTSSTICKLGNSIQMPLSDERIAQHNSLLFFYRDTETTSKVDDFSAPEKLIGQTVLVRGSRVPVKGLPSCGEPRFTFVELSLGKWVEEKDYEWVCGEPRFTFVELSPRRDEKPDHGWWQDPMKNGYSVNGTTGNLRPCIASGGSYAVQEQFNKTIESSAVAEACPDLRADTDGQQPKKGVTCRSCWKQLAIRSGSDGKSYALFFRIVCHYEQADGKWTLTVQVEIGRQYRGGPIDTLGVLEKVKTEFLTDTERNCLKRLEATAYLQIVSRLSTVETQDTAALRVLEQSQK